ncbi:hypothetical protein EV702DRAFT_1053349 [Suillus placidus]|uniref:Uncharacterized protein n=1 Tax=Suillus placidus TaxID=48579 RepID=A0A9P7CW31_9AGAM|nr:hypothetical protein EV702DRAFT_1053349 [Suillus placidus]
MTFDEVAIAAMQRVTNDDLDVAELHYQIRRSDEKLAPPPVPINHSRSNGEESVAHFWSVWKPTIQQCYNMDVQTDERNTSHERPSSPAALTFAGLSNLLESTRCTVSQRVSDRSMDDTRCDDRDRRHKSMSIGNACVFPGPRNKNKKKLTEKATTQPIAFVR